MTPSTRSTPSSLRGPSTDSRKFTGNESTNSRSQGRDSRPNRQSHTEPNQYSAATTSKKLTRSTAYVTPLSFINEEETLRRSSQSRTPLTREALENLQAEQEAESADPPLSPAASNFESRFDESSFLAFMRKSKSRSPDKKKPDRKKAKDKDLDSHPLNLPPDELKRLSARLARDNNWSLRSPTDYMADVDMDSGASAGSDTAQPYTNGNTSQPSSPAADAPGAFPDSQMDVDPREETKSPTPPPHKVPPKPQVDPEACKAAGNKFFKAKDYDRAIAEYSKAVEAEPKNATYLSNRAAAYIGAHKYEQALQDCLQANAIDPSNDKILHRLARIYTSLGRPEDALTTYSKIPNASATDTAAAKKAQSSIDMAERQIYAENGDGKMALWSIDQAKQTLGAGSPMPRRWQVLRAKANLKIGTANALGEVQSISQVLMRENSMDAEAITLAGQAFYLKDDKGVGKSDYQRAEECFRRALSIDPDNAEARNTLRTMKKLDRAKTEANEFYKSKQWQRANDAYTECLSIDPSNKITNAKIIGNRALARTKLELFDEARQDCDQALKLDPTYTKAKRTRAKIVGEAGDWEQAVKDLKALSEESPGDAEIQKELRNAELELKKSKRKDWYKILGVSKDAGDKEIERAYKKKAAVLHPDKTQGDKEKEELFKDCLEAKEVLLDPQKRQIYDSGADLMEPGMGGMGGHPFGGGFGGMGGMGGGVQIDPEMLFNMMGGMGGGRGGGMGGGGFPGGGFTFTTGGPGMGGQRGFPF